MGFRELMEERFGGRLGLRTAPEICAGARQREPEKQLALIALKTQLCDLDREGHSGLRVLTTVADPCYRFLRDMFFALSCASFQYAAGRVDLMDIWRLLEN